MATVVSLVAGITAVTAVTVAGPAAAETQGPISFDAYSTGSVNGQDGWTSTGAYDQAIVDNSTLPGAPVSFGTRSLRISDAFTSGAFGDQTFSKSTTNAAGEPTADAGGYPVGTLQSRFSTTFSFASVTPGTEQAGMHLSVSPDRGDGARMSYVRIEDSPTGWNLYFDDYKDAAPFGSGGNLNDGCGAEDDFVETQIASGLSRTPHSLQIVMDFLPGPHNDIVRVLLDGTSIKTGTSWEDYFRYCAESGGGTGGPLADKSRITRNVLFRESGTAHPANAGAGMLIDGFTVATSPGPTPVVVSYGDLAPNGPWSLEPSSNTGTFGFQNGPAPTPRGTGSLAMTIASGQHEWLNNYAYGVCALGPACNSTASKTPISSFDTLTYAVNRTSGTTMPTFNIEVHTTGTAGYTTLAFVPNAGSVVNSTWQTWDTMSPADGVWYSSQNVGSGVFNCAAFSCSASWSQVVASYPNAKVVYGLGPNLGTGGTFTGAIDDFTVGVSGNVKAFDFERVDCTTTCYANPVTGNDANTGQSADPLKTIQAGITKVQAGGTVVLSAGTFAENVVVNKNVRVQGAGTSTVVVPATSDPNCGGAGGASLCAGSSNVFLVQSNGVTIDHLTVDGDNPALSGIAVGGANVDARNGIITNHTAGTYGSLSVHDVTVKNVFLRGVYASSGGTFTFSNNVVDNVQGSPSSVAIFNFGGSGTISGNQVSHANDAIAANHSKGTQLTGNTVTTSGSGVHSDNAGDGGGSADVLSGNNVSACTAGGYGVWTFVAYIAPTVSNNTVSGCEVALAAFASCNLGGNNYCPGGAVPTVTFSGNQVTGTAGGLGLYASTTSFGFGDGEVRVNAHHNTITGADDGVYVEETGGAVASVAANRNALGGNSVHAVNNAGATNVNGVCNWWGQSSGPGAGQSVGSVTKAPWLIASGLNSNCVPIMKIGAAAVSVAEGNSGTTPVVLTVSLDRASFQSISVQWQTVAGTATALTNDFVGAFGVLTFSPGQTMKSFTVYVKGDTKVEPNESFTVQLSNQTNSILANATKTINILNDD